MTSRILCIVLSLLIGSQWSASQEWSITRKFVPGDREAGDLFGTAVALHGRIALVGAPEETGNDELIWAGAAYLFERDPDGCWVEIQKLVASDRAAGDRFGISIDLDGDYAVVGAYYSDVVVSDSTLLGNAGAVYIYKKDESGHWNEVQKLIAMDADGTDFFGGSVGISGENIIVGARGDEHDQSGEDPVGGAGSAYLFERDSSGLWLQVQKLVASNRRAFAEFGGAVAINGHTTIIGADRARPEGSNDMFGFAYVFERGEQGGWTETQLLSNSDREPADRFGHAVDIDSNWVIVGAFLEDHDPGGKNRVDGAGSAYLFSQANGEWIEQQKVVASDRTAGDFFGQSVAITQGFCLVGAYGDDQDATGQTIMYWAGSTYLFQLYPENEWREVKKFLAYDQQPYDEFGQAVDIDDRYALVGAWREDHDIFGEAPREKAGSVYAIEMEQSTSSVFASRDRSMSLWPNPSSGLIQIQFDHVESAITLHLIAADGQCITRETHKNVRQISLTIDGPAGVYFVLCSVEDGRSYSGRVLKQ